MLQAMIAATERVFTFLEEPEEIKTEKGNVDTSKLKGNVEFNHVHFGYNPEKTIINDFSATVKEGQKIAIVGPTNMLSQLKLDILKLDMKFVQSETSQSADRGILRLIVEMAHRMNLSVVAEGVETPHQLSRLQEIGCDYVQGYLFSKPSDGCFFTSNITLSLPSSLCLAS